MPYIHATFQNKRAGTTHTVYVRTQSFSICRADIDAAETALAKDFPTIWDEFRLFKLEYKSAAAGL